MDEMKIGPSKGILFYIFQYSQLFLISKFQDHVLCLFQNDWRLVQENNYALREQCAAVINRKSSNSQTPHQTGSLCDSSPDEQPNICLT